MRGLNNCRFTFCSAADPSLLPDFRQAYLQVGRVGRVERPLLCSRALSRSPTQHARAHTAHTRKQAHSTHARTQHTRASTQHTRAHTAHMRTRTRGAGLACLLGHRAHPDSPEGVRERVAVFVATLRGFLWLGCRSTRRLPQPMLWAPAPSPGLTHAPPRRHQPTVPPRPHCPRRSRRADTQSKHTSNSEGRVHFRKH
jgi:hypothetical protein